MFSRWISTVIVLTNFWVGCCFAQEGTEAASPPPASPQTTVDPGVPIDNLVVMVKPLTKTELEVEADAWFELLRGKAGQIAVLRLGVREAIDAESETNQKTAKEKIGKVEQAAQNAEQVAEETEKEITQVAETDSSEPMEETPGADSTETNGSTAGVASKIKTDLLADINELQEQRTALNDRLAVVLDSLEEKGGDVEEYRKYSVAVSSVELETSDIESVWSGLVGWATSKEGGQRWAWNVTKFILILLCAYLVAGFLSTFVNWLLERKIRLSQLAERLIANIIKYVLLLVGFAVALTALEIDVTPVLAAIGATGLVVGLALQDSLSNVASGLMILINRPFDVGDVVTAGGVTGTVRQMNLVSTNFRTFDNQTIHVPNNEIWNNVITNVTANRTRRVDLEFCIGYDDSFDNAEGIIKEVVEEHELVLNDPAPVVVTHALADSSVNIVCRPWAKTADWWQVKTDITREVKRRFDAIGISIPYPQRDVHVYQHLSSTSPKSIE
ncbi:Small-conductance mechanosensitive channel [Roseimaritima multifibrata]|uniref:Small-conductance mechanosensitive channel n=1 Tax=Roseimaritima multifibrata TaxID=1930274 RepID=A0A517MH75_9BACT|nr:Small-conductance mechanosensitive channel [Roseimaritima multifibrata]